MRFRPLISWTLAAAISLAALAFTGCSLIDEDISKCTNQARLTYQLELDPEIVQELEDELALHSDEEIRTLLKGYIDGVFTNYARDVDLYFFDTNEPMSCLRSLSETMNSASNTYAISMPVRSYMHTAVTNVKVSETAQIAGDETYPTIRLEHKKVDGVYAPQQSGLFTTHRQIDIGEKANQRFRIKLKMANAMSALVLDTGKATGVESIRVVVDGMATSFNLADSTYVYDDTAIFSTEEFVTENGYKHCYASVHFPSRDSLNGTKGEFDDGGGEDDPDAPLPKLWKWTVYATLADGTVTRSVLEMRPPIKAGQLKIRNAFVLDQGKVGSNEVDVGITVQLDWKPGLDIPVSL